LACNGQRPEGREDCIGSQDPQWTAVLEEEKKEEEEEEEKKEKK
jgi:hypothetical protein